MGGRPELSSCGAQPQRGMGVSSGEGREMGNRIIGGSGGLSSCGTPETRS